MKHRVTINTTLLIVLSSLTTIGQTMLTKDEILATLNDVKRDYDKDSLFRFEIHKQTRLTFDNLLINGVDTILIYSVSYPGYAQLNSDSCSTLYPVDSYFFWRQNGKTFHKNVTGNCESRQSIANDKLIEFLTDNFSKMTDDSFISPIYSVEQTGDRLRITGNVINHEPNYEMLLQLGDRLKYLSFTDSALTDEKSLFYDHNRNLTSFQYYELIKRQIKE
jgi:hypothetical protein